MHNWLNAKFLFASLAAAPLFLACPDAGAVDLVVPNARALAEGDGGNGFPFTQELSTRYQQAYDASQFSVLGANGGMIYYIGFRYNGSYNTASIVYDDMAVSLSTTTRAVDSLSTVFSDNLGPDDTVVYSGRYTIGVTQPPPQGQLQPWPFPMIIPFTRPFYYNPTNGNLLVDIQWFDADTYPGNGPPILDAVYYSGTLVGRVYGYDVNDDGPPTNGVLADSYGLVTMFGLSPSNSIPSPIDHFSLSGTNAQFQGSNGAPGLVFYLLTSTNLATPAADWFPSATNAFDANGGFTVTNAVPVNSSGQFYLLQVQ